MLSPPLSGPAPEPSLTSNSTSATKKGTLDSPCMKAKSITHNGDVLNAFFAYEKALHECGLRSEGLSVRRTDV